MDAGQCAICLEPFKEPVATPCGHVHCRVCLTVHINTSDDAHTSTCPTCRASYSVVVPDLTLLPRKYHPFIVPSLRRVYVDPPLELREQLKARDEQNHRLQTRVQQLERDKRQLLARAESLSHEVQNLAIRERDQRQALETLTKEKARAVKEAQELAAQNAILRASREPESENERAVRPLPKRARAAPDVPRAIPMPIPGDKRQRMLTAYSLQPSPSPTEDWDDIYITSVENDELGHPPDDLPRFRTSRQGRYARRISPGLDDPLDELGSYVKLEVIPQRVRVQRRMSADLRMVRSARD